jgi:hypothetical protein
MRRERERERIGNMRRNKIIVQSVVKDDLSAFVIFFEANEYMHTQTFQVYFVSLFYCCTSGSIISHYCTLPLNAFGRSRR